MDFEHCDDYEAFLYELILNIDKLSELYKKACDCVEPLAENINYTKEEEIQDDMDDCWDNEWINPHTGIPHYHMANFPEIFL